VAVLGYRISNRWAGNTSGQSYDDITFFDNLGNEDSSIIYLDLQVSAIEISEVVDAAEIYLDIQASGVDEYVIPVESVEAATVYLDIRVRGVEEGIFWETFENLDAWDVDPSYPLRETIYITKRHATEGDSSLRFTTDSIYAVDPAQPAVKWIDTVNGDNPAIKYWLSYSFMLEDWERVWRDNNNPQGMFLPAQIAVVDDYDGNYGLAPTIEALTETTGQISFSDGAGTTDIALNAQQWYQYQIGYQDDGTDITFEYWLDGVQVAVSDAVYLGLGDPLKIPKGIWMGNDNSNVSGLFYIDDMIWSPDVQPRQSYDVESAPGTTHQQWVKIREKESGAGAEVTIEIDTVTEAWLYAEIFIPADLQFNVEGSNEFSNDFLKTDNTNFAIKRVGLTNVWNWVINSVDLGIPVEFDRWYRLSWHELAGSTTLEYQIDSDLFSTTYIAPTGTNFIRAAHPVSQPPISGGYIGIDNLAYSTENWVRADRFDYHWDFEGLDPLNDANTNYPTPPLIATFGPGDYVTSLEEGGVGPGPGLPEGLSGDDAIVILTFYVESVEVYSTTYDDAEIYFDLQLPFVAGQEAYGSAEFATIYLDMQPGGGECHSTWLATFLGEGEAYLDLYASVQTLEWSASEELEWSFGDVVTEGINC
jgi:hypothetical protein